MGQLISVLFVLVIQASALAGPDHAFASTTTVPAQVDVFVSIDQPDQVWQQLERSPLGSWLAERLVGGEFGTAWTQAAAQIGLDGRSMLTRSLGDQLTFASRAAVDGEPDEWILISDVGRERSAQLLRQLHPRALGPFENASLFELTGHSMLVASRDGKLVAAPPHAKPLLREVLRLMDDQTLPSLASDPGVARLHDLGPASAGVFVRHERPLGGWSGMTITLTAGAVRTRVRSAFENAPFSRPRCAHRWDPAPLRGFERASLVAFAEPLEIGPSMFEIMFEDHVGASLISASMRENLGTRRIIAIGEQELRLADPPLDLLAPTFAVCFEVKDCKRARDELDRSMARFINSLSHFGEHTFSIDDIASDGNARRIDLTPAVDWFLDDVPLFGEVSLNWTVDQGPHGVFCIVASHTDQLAEALRALHRAETSNTTTALDQCGAANGMRLAGLLRSWAVQAPSLAEPGHEDRFSNAARVMAGFAENIRRCRWNLVRPSDNEMALEIEFHLREFDSSDRR